METAPTLDDTQAFVKICKDRMRQLITQGMFDEFAVTQFEQELENLEDIDSYLRFIRHRITNVDNEFCQSLQNKKE